jgi:hypothetical protein
MGIKTGQPRGRPKGAHSKATLEQQRAVKESGVTPLEYMLSIMRDEMADPKRRDYMAQAASPYVHAKLASVEVGNKAGEVFKVGLLSEDGGLL